MCVVSFTLWYCLCLCVCLSVSLSVQSSHVCIGQKYSYVQLGLHKRRLSYDFSFYVGRTELRIWIFVSRQADIVGASPRRDYRSDEDGTILAHNYIFYTVRIGRSKKGGTLRGLRIK
jgi:hypothetical protein